MAARSKALAIGAPGWVLEERHQSNDLVAQELEDFGFSVRNELEWLNEHMSDIFANNGVHNLEVFKTPGKLRGKTPRTARKKNPAEPRQLQPLASILSANGQKRPSPAEQNLKNNLQKAAKARFHIAEDTENTIPVKSPAAKTPIARQLFSKTLGAGKENADTSFHADTFDERPAPQLAPWSPMHATQDTVMSSQDDDVFSPPRTQSTQPTQATQSFRRSIHEQEDERRDTGDSFVSAKEAFASKNPSKENLHEEHDDAMDLDDDRADLSRSDGQDTVIRHELSSAGEEDDEEMQDIPDFPEPPRVISEQYSISAETHDALDLANQRALAPEPKNLFAPEHSTTPAGPPPASSQEAAHDDTVVHHEIDDQMEIDDVRSPSDGSSPVKPLVRKSSLTFASLPAREPLLAKKSMGNRVSRTSHVDPSKARSSQMGRFTGGKSLGGSQIANTADAHHDDDFDIDMARPELQREESETTKIHNKTSTQRLYERINMLKQQNEAPKRVSQNVLSSQSSQPQSFSSTQPKEDAPQIQAIQPSYPSLPAADTKEDDDDDDWISPVRTAAVAPKVSKPALSKSQSAMQQSPTKAMPSKLISVSNPDLSIVAESTTPAGSPTGRKYMDGPLSASKSKLYSAFRAAKEKLIGSSATSAQAKLDVLNHSPMRPKLQAQNSSEDIFSSPKRTDKPGTIFSHLRSPSKESNKSGKSAAMPGSPLKDSRRTRSSTEREKQKEKETREKEVKDARQQRAEDKLREMREKEQSKAAAHHQKTKLAGAKTPSAMSSQSSLRQPGVATAATKTPVQTTSQQQPMSRPAIARVNTASSKDDVDSADEMPPPPPPKSLLPTTKTTKAALREPRKLVKPTSKEALTKAKAPQKIMVNLNSSRYGQAPPAASRPTPTTSSKPLPVAPQPVTKPSAPAPKAASGASSRPASALSTKSASATRVAPPTTKPAAPRVGRPQPQVVEKPKAPVSQPRADLGAARPVSRMQTVQDANRINVPPVNPAKPPKRPFQGENDETLHRPAKRPSQQAKMNPITPAHAQFAKGKIPFAEPAHAPQPQPPQIQYPNGDDIKLPEIMTDSEDEDSENEFEQPSWVNTPNLREMLSNQQLMDPETIFGPIAPLEMEKVFPNKERHKRFRERTSSAFWANDQVTEEEKRKEREARERLVREGAWTYNPSPRPTPGPSR
ncbi:hypothetical protein N0V83_004764 [Neocucurbitaria cava]|uniref:Inner centromere protein ARK-binding domain-containing protein n=1 Tax=Neocucurbitaria cava TaxID=798079 RepID=A0A9W8YCL6_9PLEO|nr:hypothetical protein N0V83_004764 [Neocucurbitaria cava]